MTREELIERLVSGWGGVTKAEAEILGIGWPPPKGWRKALLKDYFGVAPKKQRAPKIRAELSVPVADMPDGFMYRARKTGTYHIVANGQTLCRRRPTNKHEYAAEPPQDMTLCTTCAGLKITDPHNRRIPGNKPSAEFYSSWEWKKARYETFKRYGRVCMCCGSIWNIVVDHIKPRRFYPDLELDLNNLQVLCNDCNQGKSYDDQTDFRPK